MTEVTYNQFRGLHKGTPQKKVSKLWKKYKDGKYKLPAKESDELSAEEEIHSQMKISDMVMEENPGLLEPEPTTPVETTKVPSTELSMLEKCAEYDRLSNTLSRFSFKFNEVETKKVLDRVAELASDTRPEGYVCEPTDSWKLWLGPTENCLLINTTRGVAFRVTRGWWQKHYQTTIYVDRELLNNTQLIDDTAKAFALTGRYLPRSPVVGVECKLPQTVKDIQMRGGFAGDR